jgi:hypothetical protein
MSAQTRIVITHEVRSIRETLASSLRTTYPSFVIDLIDPRRLQNGSLDLQGAIVLFSEPTGHAQHRSRGWIMPYIDTNISLIGVGDVWRIWRTGAEDDLAKAIQFLLACTTPGSRSCFDD